MVCSLFSLFRTKKWTHVHHFSLASISLQRDLSSTGDNAPKIGKNEYKFIRNLWFINIVLLKINFLLRRTQYFISTQTELRTATQTEPGPFPYTLVYKYTHYEASFPKHFILITLFLQAHIVMFIYLFVCLLLVYFMEAALLCSFLPFFAGNP